jgi:hypothetical protein
MTTIDTCIAMNPWRKLLFVVAAATLVMPWMGCSDGRPTRVPVSGRVLIDGQPLANGNIRFHSKEHRPASAKINPDGSFTLSTYEFGDGCVEGEHPVSINGSQLINPMTMRWLAPKKYANAATSELVYNVSGPTDNAEFNVTWDGSKPFDERIIGSGE